MQVYLGKRDPAVAGIEPRSRVMSESWTNTTVELSAAIKELRGGAPEVMKGFSAMAQAALKADALDTKTKELIALAIAVATRCDGCVAFHAEAAVKQGATRQEVLETMGMAVYMGAGPSVMYAAQALEAYDEFRDVKARGA
jgi:AhpD family alkylhydroperoxidase